MSSLKARAIHVFLIFWLHQVFVAALRLSFVAASRSYPLSRCMGVTCVDVLIRYSETGYLNQFNTVGIDVINKSNVAFYLEAENENEIQ